MKQICESHRTITRYVYITGEVKNVLFLMIQIAQSCINWL